MKKQRRSAMYIVFLLSLTVVTPVLAANVSGYAFKVASGSHSGITVKLDALSVVPIDGVLVAFGLLAALSLLLYRFRRKVVAGITATGAVLCLVTVAYALLFQTTTLVSGKYSFSGIPQGEYQLIASAPGFQTTTLASLNIGTDDVFVDAIYLPSASTPTPTFTPTKTPTPTFTPTPMGAESSTVSGAGLVEFFNDAPFEVGIDVTSVKGSTRDNVTIYVEAYGGLPPDVGKTNVIYRYWVITLDPPTAQITANLTFNYYIADIRPPMTENDIEGAYRHNGTSWEFKGGTLNTTLNNVTLTGLTQFSPWALGNNTGFFPPSPTATPSVVNTNSPVPTYTPTPPPASDCSGATSLAFPINRSGEGPINNGNLNDWFSFVPFSGRDYKITFTAQISSSTVRLSVYDNCVNGQVDPQELLGLSTGGGDQELIFTGQSGNRVYLEVCRILGSESFTYDFTITEIPDTPLPTPAPTGCDVATPASFPVDIVHSSYLSNGEYDWVEFSLPDDDMYMASLWGYASGGVVRISVHNECDSGDPQQILGEDTHRQFKHHVNFIPNDLNNVWVEVGTFGGSLSSYKLKVNFAPDECSQAQWSGFPVEINGAGPLSDSNLFDWYRFTPLSTGTCEARLETDLNGVHYRICAFDSCTSDAPGGLIDYIFGVSGSNDPTLSFTGTANDEIWLEVARTSGNETFDYNILVLPPPTPTPTWAPMQCDSATPESFPVNITNAGPVNRDEFDWVEFTAPTTGTYMASLVGYCSGGLLRLSVHDDCNSGSPENLLGESVTWYTEHHVVFSPGNADSVWVEVAAITGNIDHYDLSVGYGPDDCEPAQSVSFPVEVNGAGPINNGNTYDWYRFTPGTAGQYYVQLETADADEDYRLTVFDDCVADKPGSIVASVSGKSQTYDPVLDFYTLGGDEYWLEVARTDSSDVYNYNITINAPATPTPYPTPGQCDTADFKPFPVNVSKAGPLQYSEFDWIEFVAPDTEPLTASFYGYSSGAPIRLSAYDDCNTGAPENLLGESTHSSGTTHVNFTPSMTGSIWFGVENHGGYLSNYDLTVYYAAKDCDPAQFATFPVEINGAGPINYSNLYDWVRFTPPATGTHEVRLETAVTGITYRLSAYDDCQSDAPETLIGYVHGISGSSDPVLEFEANGGDDVWLEITRVEGYRSFNYNLTVVFQ